MKTGHSRRLERRADKEVLAQNSILNENAGETISVSPLKMSRVLLRACSGGGKEKKKKRKKLARKPVRLQKNFSLFNGVTRVLYAREASFSSKVCYRFVF